MKSSQIAGLFLAAILSMTAQAAIYKTIDENGNVVYSDSRPAGQNSKEVDLKPITPMPALSPQKNSQKKPSEPKSSKYYYSELKVIDPANGATIRNEGNFTVRIQVSPKLATSHRVRLLLDGKKVDKPKRSLRFTLLNIDRGSHDLKVEIIDSRGRLIQSSANSKVYVQRTIYRPPPPANAP